MIAADTSVLIDYINGVAHPLVERLAKSISAENLLLPPAIVTELYGIKSNPNALWKTLAEDTPLLEIYDGYWERAGKNRQKLLAKKYKARLGDVLIAQSCIDHDVPLLTRYPDFRPYAKLCGLTLAELSK